MQLATALARLADENKAEDIVVLDLTKLTSMTDYFVICTGTSTRQIRAVADFVEEYGQELGQRPYSRAGYQTAQWVLIDYVDVVVHIFDQEHRHYYDLELMWGDAPRIDWTQSCSA